MCNVHFTDREHFFLQFIYMDKKIMIYVLTGNALSVLLCPCMQEEQRPDESGRNLELIPPQSPHITSTVTLLLLISLLSCSQVTAGDQIRRAGSTAGDQTRPLVQEGREGGGLGVDWLERIPSSVFILVSSLIERLSGDVVSGLSGLISTGLFSPLTKHISLLSR